MQRDGEKEWEMKSGRERAETVTDNDRDRKSREINRGRGRQSEIENGENKRQGGAIQRKTEGAIYRDRKKNILRLTGDTERKKRDTERNGNRDTERKR